MSANTATSAAPAPANPVVEGSGFGKIYRRGAETIHALSDLSLRVVPGEFVLVLGPSGAGKTTLLNLLGAMDVPSSGSLTVAGRQVAKDGRVLLSEGKRDRLRRENIGFIFTEFFLMPTLSAVDNVRLPLLWTGREDRGRAVELLTRVGLGHRLTHRPSEMSGGEMQRVAIARAIVNRPDVLLADEPTGNLDTKRSAEIVQTLREVNRSTGLTIVMVTHNPELASQAGRTLEMRDGRLGGA